MKRINILAVAAALIAIAIPASAQHRGEPDEKSSLAKAEILFQNENYTAAEIELRDFLNSFPHCDNTAQKQDEEKERAKYLLLCSQYENGTANKKDIASHLRQYPASAHRNTLLFFLGHLEFEAGNYRQANKHLDQCDFFDLKKEYCEDALYASALSNLNTGHEENAKINFLVLRDTSLRYAKDASYNLSYLSYKEKHFAKALAGFTKLAGDAKYGLESIRYMADIYLQKKDYDKAIQLSDRYMHQYGGNSKGINEAQRIKGEALYGKGNYAAAAASLQTYRNAVSHPSREALYMLGMSYFHTQAYAKSANTLEETTTTGDALAQNAYLHAGIAHLKLMDTGRARIDFEHAANMPHDADATLQALYNYALCIRETSYSPFNESVKVFEKLINEYPDSKYTRLASTYLADAYLASNDYEASLRSIDQIKRPNTSLLRAKQIILYRLGTQQFSQKHYAKAIATLTEAVSSGKQDANSLRDAYYWRGDAYYQTGRLPQAANDYARYLSLAGENGEYAALAHYNIGYIHFKQKQYDAALAAFRKSATANNSLPAPIRADMANRMGDCYYHNRQFAQAETCYAQAAETDSSQGDYALYQRAFILGLQKDYAGKVAQIDDMLRNYPQSPLCDDALFEKGRAYVMAGDRNKAIKTYATLTEQYPASPYARRALTETALLHYQMDDYANAEKIYKEVIRKYAGTAEAAQARNDLKSICVDQNRVDDYFRYMASIGQNAGMDQDFERDSLTYIAAERIFIAENKARGCEAMKKYLANFPNGTFKANANYYVGLYYYNEKQPDKALPYLSATATEENSQFAEETMLMVSQIHFDKKDFGKALETYERLEKVASAQEKILTAKIGIMRCAAELDDRKLTKQAATNVLNYPKADPQTTNEALYLRAQAFAADKQVRQAMDDWKKLAEDTQNEFGAEAKYRVAEIYFDEKEYGKAEKVILDYINKGTPYPYWMARSFVLLSDIYQNQGKKNEARQYLISLKQNYSESEEINRMIETRLEKLKE